MDKRLGQVDESENDVAPEAKNGYFASRSAAGRGAALSLGAGAMTWSVTHPRKRKTQGLWSVQKCGLSKHTGRAVRVSEVDSRVVCAGSQVPADQDHPRLTASATSGRPAMRALAADYAARAPSARMHDSAQSGRGTTWPSCRYNQMAHVALVTRLADDYLTYKTVFHVLKPVGNVQPSLRRPQERHR